MSGLNGKKLLRWGGGAALALLCLGVLTFLVQFTQVESPLTVVTWDSAAVLDAGGGERPLDPAAPTAPELEDGELLVFRAVVPPCRPDDELWLELSGMEAELRLDGVSLLRTESPLPDGTPGLAQARIPLPPDAEGKTLELRCHPLAGADLAIFPPMPRLVSPAGQDSENIAYANFYGMHAAAMAVVLLLVCFLFFFGLLAGTPDWSLPVLAAAAVVIGVYRLAAGLGYFFLPPAAVSALSWRGLEYLGPALLLAYFVLNRRRAFWRRLGRCSLWSAGALGAAWLVSLARGGYLSRYLPILAEEVSVGSFSGLLYWATAYLTTACAGIAAWGVMETIAKARAEASALELKAELSVKNLRAIEKSDREAAALHHELNHHITAMQALYQAGRQEELGAYLARLRHQADALPRVRFTENVTVNAILQDAAARAAAQDIRFTAAAAVPPELPIPTEDLCCLLMNLLDNALEAAGRVSETDGRSVCFHCQIKSGFLGVKCENSYAVRPEEDPETGEFRSTKPDAAAHGFGMKQMQIIAEKYQSRLVVSYTGTVFTVQTALKLPERP